MLYKKSYKAATLLYDEKRSKGSSGMSVRQVAEKNKKIKGVGPSASTIHHYVVDLGMSGQSPLKNKGRRLAQGL